MSVAETLQQDMKTALRAGNKLETGALRMALAAIKNREIEQGSPLDDAAVVGVLEKLIKQGREAQQQFEAAGRNELAAKESAEADVLSRYLPEPLSADQVEALIAAKIGDVAAAGIKDMGKVMAAIKSDAAGRVDMGAVSKRVREILAAD